MGVQGATASPPGSRGTPRWGSWGTHTPGWGSWAGTGYPVDRGAPGSRAMHADDAQGVPGFAGHPRAALGGPGWHRVPTCHGAPPRWAGGAGVAPDTPWVMRQPRFGLGWAGSRHLVGRGAPSRQAARGRGGLNLRCPDTAPPRRAARSGAGPGSPRSRGLPTHPGGSRTPGAAGQRRAGTEVSGWHPQGSPDTRGTPPDPAPTWGQVPSRGGPHGGAAAQALPTRGVMAGAGGAARPLRPRRAAGSSSRRRPGAWHGWARARARVGSARRCPRLRGAEPSPRRALSRGGRSAPRAGPAA